MKSYITDESIFGYESYLRQNERAESTIKKYICVVKSFKDFSEGRKIKKELCVEYREALGRTNSIRTINSKVSAINSFADYMEHPELRIKFLKLQRRAFLDEGSELSETEYYRLLTCAKRTNNRLYYIMLTICTSGIRVSELRFITVEAVRRGRAQVRLKGKCREIILQKRLCEKLLAYVSMQDIEEGMIFRTKTGKAIDRSNIHHSMKKLCDIAEVDPKKVYPHNLRHLFAKIYYENDNNIAHLADILGHSSIETTRIYVATGLEEYERIFENMDLII